RSAKASEPVSVVTAMAAFVRYVRWRPRISKVVRNYCGHLPSQIGGVSVRNNLARLSARPESADISGIGGRGALRRARRVRGRQPIEAVAAYQQAFLGVRGELRGPVGEAAVADLARLGVDLEA